MRVWSRSPTLSCATLLLVLLSACANNPPQRAARSQPEHLGREPGSVQPPRSERGNPPFYDVFGKRYHVLPTSAGYVARGVASWYGRDFHGLATSSGEPYDMHAMTAAHTTLPIPTWVEVTNLGNGKRVVVRVNDRGPFVDNRLIDLSYAAATALDIVRNGTARVEVRTVAPPRGGEVAAEVLAAVPAPVAALPGGFATQERMFVQVGAFTQRDNAARLVERLRASGFANPELVSTLDARRTLHRVRLGPIASAAEFDTLNARLRAMGVSGSRLVVERGR